MDKEVPILNRLFSWLDENKIYVTAALILMTSFVGAATIMMLKNKHSDRLALHKLSSMGNHDSDSDSSLKTDDNDASVATNLPPSSAEDIEKEEAKKRYATGLTTGNIALIESRIDYAFALVDKFNDKNGAKQYYLKTIEKKPEYGEAHFEYALLLDCVFDDNKGARFHYEKALELDPLNADAHHNYAIFLKFREKNNVSAKEHYLTATKLNPNLISVEADKIFGVGR